MLDAAKPLPRYLIDRYRSWHDGPYQDNSVWYRRLQKSGQSPRAMVIGCCDSRIDIVQMFGAQPGDIFVVRNVANLVPPHSPDHHHHGTSAAVEYAVSSLMVAHIVVVGHSNCGGIRACHDMCAGLSEELEEGSSYVGRWMDIMRPAYDNVCQSTPEGEERVEALEKEAVLTSLRNLTSFPFVKSAMDRGVLTLHGCWIEIGTGELRVYDSDKDSFV